MNDILEPELYQPPEKQEGPQATMDHVKSLAFNRSTSSEGETESLVYIQDQVAQTGIPSFIEHFSYIGARKVLMRLTYAIILTYLLMFRMWLIIIIYISIKYLFGRLRRLSFIREEDSKNIFTILPAKNRVPRRPVIILSAHYDSFSANIPYKYQNALFLIFKIIVIPYFVVTIGFAVWFIIDFVQELPNKQFVFVLVLISSIIEFFIIALLFLLIYNRSNSMGSIDNASGVSILIELAKSIKKEPLDNVDILCIWPGAEEWGLVGSKRFVKRHKKELQEVYDLDRSCNINIDMVGSYIGLFNNLGLYKRKRINNSVNDIIEESAKKLEIPIVKFNKVRTPKSDHRSFRSLMKKPNSKFEVAYFHSDKDDKYIHSPRDTPDKCSSKILNGCLDICNDTIRAIDSKNK